jgi:ABC-type glycerol-3-phosphate transport system permease component
LLAVFVIMVAVPLFWMVTTAIKTNKELYEDFSYVPQRPTLENFVRVIVREKLFRRPVLYWAVFRGAGPGGWRCEELSRRGREMLCQWNDW